MPSLAKLRWYWKRAKLISGREAVHRLRGALETRRLRRDWERKTGICAEGMADPARFDFCSASTSRLGEVPFRWDEAAARHEEIADGGRPEPPFRWRWRDEPAVWHAVQDGARRWPLDFFADIEHRPGNPWGDAREIWEASRLQHLVPMALAAQHGSDGYAAVRVASIERQLVSWVNANPPLTGINHASAMECALRIVAVCHAVDLIRGRLDRSSPVWAALPALIRTQAGLIERKLSLFSSLGNHTIAEATGLLYAGILFPELEGAARWQEIGLALLVQEAPRQILDDGGGIEQAFWYHAFVVDLCGLVLRLLALKGSTAPPALTAAVERGRAFLAAFADRQGRLPDIGDRDDGYALSPLLHQRAPRTSPPPASETFSMAGYTRISVAAAADSFLVFDHGPLGMAPGFGHGHADALALFLVLDGEIVLNDPGTYGYGLEAEWREYFRSTAAHNTVVLDDADQARQETRFQWSAPYTSVLARIEEGEGGLLALARHDGYASRGAIHWRGLFVAREGFAVVDTVVGTRACRTAAHWHCGVPVVSAGTPGRYQLKCRNGHVSLEAEGGSAELFEGSLSPRLGWTAPVYGKKVPQPTLRIARDGGLPHTIATRFRFDGRFMPLPFEGQARERIRQWTANG